MATFEELLAVKRRHSSDLLRCAGVCGLDVDTDRSGQAQIVVHLESNDPEIRQQLPEALEGHPLKFVQTGPIRKQRAGKQGKQPG